MKSKWEVGAEHLEDEARSRNTGQIVVLTRALSRIGLFDTTRGSPKMRKFHEAGVWFSIDIRL